MYKAILINKVKYENDHYENNHIRTCCIISDKLKLK